MASIASTRRSYGSGSLFTRTDAAGVEAWYGKFYVDGKQVKRKLGPKRTDGSRDGLTVRQAEAELRKVIEKEHATPAVAARVTFADAAERMLRGREARGLKPSTMKTYRNLIDVHLNPRFKDRELHKIEVKDLDRMVRDMTGKGSKPKLILNVLGIAHSVFEYGRHPKRGWCQANPCEHVEKPRVQRSEDIRYLTQEELEAVIRAIPSATTFGPTDRALILTAAMTGLRQGELLALRWEDVDWPASSIRVRRNYVRGEWGTPKTRRSSRAVPMADRVATELELHSQRSHYTASSDLVFGHPHTGNVLGHSALAIRFKQALTDAEARQIRFHDLRHTFGTTMASAGVSMQALQEWLGHRDSRTTDIYADYRPRPADAALVQAAFAPEIPAVESRTRTQGTIQGTKLT